MLQHQQVILRLCMIMANFVILQIKIHTHNHANANVFFFSSSNNLFQQEE